MEGSPAALCGQLHVGDRVIAVNGIDIIKLPHNDIVTLIKKSGLSVRLTISPSSSPGFLLGMNCYHTSIFVVKDSRLKSLFKVRNKKSFMSDFRKPLTLLIFCLGESRLELLYICIEYGL